MSFSVGAEEAPRVIRAQGTGDVLTVWGVGFSSEHARVVGWSAATEPGEAREFLETEGGPGWRSMEIPDGAAEWEVLATEERGYVLAAAIPFGGSHGRPDFLAVRSGAGDSPVYPLSLAKPTMVFPERARAGETVRIFGTDLARFAVGIRNAKSGLVVFADLSERSGARNSVYEVDFVLPEDLDPGDYELFVHNGRGGAAAWGGPLSLSILEPLSEEPEEFDASKFGVVGDGVTDNTQALRAVLQAAGDHGGGIVRLPTGSYPVSATLWIPENVTLRGNGPTQTVIVVREQNPMRFDVPTEVFSEMPGHLRSRMRDGNLGTIFWMRNHSGLEGVRVEDGPGVLNAVFGEAVGVRIEQCHFLSRHSLHPTILVEWGSYGLVIRNNEILTAGCGIFLTHGPNIQSYIGYNRIRAYRHGYPLQTSNLVHIRAPERSLMEENHFSLGDRNFVVMSRGLGSYHNVLVGNFFENGLPRRHNAGELMYEGGRFTWTGMVKSATPTGIAVEGAPFSEEAFPRGLGPVKRAEEPGTNQVVVILDGRGMGQYRRVLDHTENSLIVEGEWDVIPDETSFVAVAPAFVESLWIDNTEDSTASWSGFWGTHLGHTVDGHILRRGEGFYLWAYDERTAVLFNTIRENWLTDRSRFVIRGRGIVYGNSYDRNEVANFWYRPNFHGTTTWAHPQDDRVTGARSAIAHRAGVEMLEATPSPGWPETVLYRGWNLFDRNLILDGPDGFRISEDATHTILSRNVISVRDDSLVDRGMDTLVIRSFDDDAEEATEVEPVETFEFRREGAPEAGDRNLALGRPVSSSRVVSAERLATLTNGVTDGGSVAGGPGPQFIQVDLGEVLEVSRVRVWQFHRSRRAYEGVVIQLSEDPDFHDGVVTVFNNDSANMAGQGAGEDAVFFSTDEGMSVDFPEVSARFIRAWSNGNTDNMFNHWNEIQAFGPR